MTKLTPTVEELHHQFIKLAVVDVEYVDGRVKHFRLKGTDKIWSFITKYFVPRGEVEKKIEDARKEAINEVKEKIKTSFRSSYSGMMGYQVLPDCDENDHDIEDCADCILNNLTPTQK